MHLYQCYSSIKVSEKASFHVLLDGGLFFAIGVGSIIKIYEPSLGGEEIAFLQQSLAWRAQQRALVLTAGSKMAGSCPSS